MVARIKSGTSIKGAINYNEHKVRDGKAVLIAAPRFYKEVEDLTFKDKLLRLQKLAQLNERVKTNCLHLSLNFHPNDKLARKALEKMAAAYMQGIGFGSQPYLVYQHLDAHHTHLHIVTTNIQKDGRRISMHNLGRGPSETTRKRIQKDFGLVKAEGQEAPLDQYQPLKKLVYGAAPTKQALSCIVAAVVRQYAFASLPEFNAILNVFGVAADSGKPGSRMFMQKGLLYSALDEKGSRIGVPIKASALWGKPTLSRLETVFDKGRQHKKRLQKELVEELQPVFRLHTLMQIKEALQQKGVEMVCRYNQEGFLYGVTYVDHTRKVVFKGSELGKAFSAAALRDRDVTPAINSEPTSLEKKRPLALPASKVDDRPTPVKDTSQSSASHLPQWLQSQEEAAYVPYELRRKHRRKKGKTT